MAESPDSVAPAGWFVDPLTHRHLRWWNGQAWTESVAPLPGVAPAASVAPAPQVHRQFALESTADPAGAAFASTAASTAENSAAADVALPFVHQVAEAIAQPAQPEPVAEQPDTSPAIPWPAVQPAAAAATSAPSYGSYPGFDTVSTPTIARSSFVPATAAAVAAPLPSVDAPLPSVAETDPPFLSRRQLREREAAGEAAPVVPAASTFPSFGASDPAPSPSASSAPGTLGLPTATPLDDGPDVWAGHDDRGDRVAAVTPDWSGFGSPRATIAARPVPTGWSTASVWLLAVTPWLGLASGVAALAFFEAWSIPAFGVLLLPYLLALLFAQQDTGRLRDLGHERPARAGWVLLTAPVYLLMRTIAVKRTTGAGTAPLWVWLANVALVAGGCWALATMPGLVPGYLVEFAEPLRATATAWLTLPG